MNKLNKIIESYPPELKMVLVCCGSERWKAEDLLPVIDWDLFLQLMKRHRLNTFTYSFIKNNSILFPEDVINKINNMQLKVTSRSLQLVSELMKIGIVFNENNIKWLAIKGPAFSLQLYNDPTLRQSIDLDILIESKELEKTIAVLLKNGYKSVHPLPNLNKSFKQYLKFSNEIAFVNPITNIPIEIHWKFAPYQILNSFDFNYIYENKKIIKLNNTEIPTLNFEEHVKYVCRHGFIHQWNSLYWLVDIGQLIKINNNLHELKQKSPFLSGAISLYEFIFNKKEIPYHKDFRFAIESIALREKEELHKLNWRIRRGFYFANIDKSMGTTWNYFRYLLYKFKM